MDEKIRRVVAYAAAGRASGRFSSSVFCCASGQHCSMSESYDYAAGSVFSVAKQGNMHHYGTGSHVSLVVRGHRFSGYDYGSGSHFTGTIRGLSVQV